jgi:hypothetical protein
MYELVNMCAEAISIVNMLGALFLHIRPINKQFFWSIIIYFFTILKYPFMWLSLSARNYVLS